MTNTTKIIKDMEHTNIITSNTINCKTMQKALGITDDEFQKQLDHFDKTGQVLNRAVALAKGLTE